MGAELVLENIAATRASVAGLPRTRLAGIVQEILDESFIDAAVRGTKSAGTGAKARLRRAPRVETLLDRMYKTLYVEAQKVGRKQVNLASKNAVRILRAIDAGPRTGKAEQKLRAKILRSKTLDLDQKTELLTRHVRQSVDAQVASRIEETVDTMRSAGQSQQAILERFKRLGTVANLQSSLTTMLDSAYTHYGRRVASAAEIAGFQAQGYKSFTWVAVNRPDGSPKLCPDCSARHGVTGNDKFWDDIGRPGDGKTVCGTSCYCALIPKEYADQSPDVFAVPIDDDRPLVLTTGKEVRKLDARGPGVTDRKE